MHSKHLEMWPAGLSAESADPIFSVRQVSARVGAVAQLEMSAIRNELWVSVLRPTPSKRSQG